MGLIFRRRKSLGSGTTLNVSKSGASLSKRTGRVRRFNSRGQARVRILPWVSWRFKL